MYFWRYILAKKAGLSQQKCNMALYGLPVLPIAEAFEKTVTGNPITITDAIAEDALSLQVAFEPTQSGTPWIDSEPTTEPYLSKTIPRGNREYYSLVGASVAWNQLVSDRNSTTSHDITYSIINNVVSLNGTANGQLLLAFAVPVKDHVMFVDVKYNGTPTHYVKQNSVGTFYNSRIYKHTYQDVNAYYIVVPNEKSIDETFTLRIFDLTLMFGSTIADYVYSLESGTAGAGVQWLKDHGFLTKDYYPYNPGELISVKTSGHKVGSTTYPLSDTELRGLFKLDVNNKLYADGDTYKPDGTVTRKYGIVDLGTVDYVSETSGTYGRFYTSGISTLIKKIDGMTNLVCSLFLATPTLSTVANNNGYMWASSAGNVSFSKNGYTTTESFKTAMSGVYLIYELETPTTESLTPYTSPIVVEQGGTEEFIDNRTVPVPVGNETYYAAEYAVEGKASVTVNHSATSEDTPTEYEVQFTSQGTVYGGTVDIVSGVLSVTWAILSNPQNLHWISNSSQGMKNFQTASGTVSKKNGSNNWKCSRYSNGFIGTDKTEGIFIFDSGEVCIRDYLYWEHGGTSAEEAAFKASLADVTIAYELATPQTYNLTPEQVTMLLGNNYLVTEDGTITLTYMAGK